MEFRVQDVSSSFVTGFAFSFLCCSVITGKVSSVSNDGILSVSALALLSVAFLIFVGWIVWLLKKYIGKRRIIKMPRRPGKVYDTVNWILSVMWIAMSLFDGICRPVVVFVAWGLFALAAGYYFYYCNRYGFTD